MGFKDFRDKAVAKANELAESEEFGAVRKKATELKQNEQLIKIWDKAVERAVEPQTNKDHAKDAAIHVGLALATGGALIPVIALAAAEQVVVKQWQKSDKAKEIAAKRSKKNDVRKDGPKPE